MKKKLNLFYWSLPVLFAILWFLQTLLFTSIHDKILASLPAEFFQERQILGPSPRVGMIVFSPVIMLVLCIWLYILLYIERKLIYNWKVVVGINVLLLIVCLKDEVGLIIQAYTETTGYAEWIYYRALESFLQHVPFILVSFFTLSLIRKRLVAESGERKNDIYYDLFYLLPLLYICFMAILGYVLSGIIGIGGNNALSKHVDNIGLGYSGLFTMPVCALSLWLYKKFGRNRYAFFSITVFSAILMAACWSVFNAYDKYEGSVAFSIVILCLEVLPWTIASHYIASKYLERNLD